MAPVRPELIVYAGLERRADGDGNYNLDATPVEAVVVPIAVLILLLTGAAIVSVHRYYRRRKDGSQNAVRNVEVAAPKSSRKYIPNWLSNWLGSSKSKAPQPTAAELQKSSFDIFDETRKPFADGQGRKDGDSDSITLRPISVDIPSYPLMTHDRYSRYPMLSRTELDVRPKVLGVPFR